MVFYDTSLDLMYGSIKDVSWNLDLGYQNQIIINFSYENFGSTLTPQDK
jgi:hypothetical protein